MLKPSDRPFLNSHDRERRRDPANRAKPQFKALTQDGTLELLCYGEIVDAGTITMLESWGYPTDGFVSSMNIKKAMDAAGAYRRIRLRINSPGGDAFEGMAIHNLVAGCGKPVDVIVDGIAASSAAVVAMAGSTRTMGAVSMMMIHNAWTSTTGNKGDHLKSADTLDTIDQTIAFAFVSRTGQSQSEIQALMDAETWLTAQDCLDQGFATAIAEVPEEEAEAAVAMARSFRTLNRWRSLPETFRAARNDDPNANGCNCPCDECKDGDCASCSNVDCEDPKCEDCPMQNGVSDLSLQEAISWQLARGIGV